MDDPVARYAARLDRLLGQPAHDATGLLEAAMTDERLVRASGIVYQFAEDVRGKSRGVRQERMVLRGALLPPLF